MKQSVLWVMEENPGRGWRLNLDVVTAKRKDAESEARYWSNYYEGKIKFRVVKYVREQP